MAVEKLCPGCLEEKGTSKTCPHCGYLEEAVAESLLHLPPGTVLQDKYYIGRVLGQGGFGITYLAVDLILKIKLAIKEYLPQQLATRVSGQSHISVFEPSLEEEFKYGRSKFLEEARTLARFSEHPGVVSVRDYFEANDTAYLVMNYHEGLTLQRYLEESGGRISFTETLEIFMPVLDALKEVHRAGILHRDISPDNLLINTAGRVILIDFGAARQAMGEKSKSLSVIMKAGYSPPEQYRSRGRQGPWTDIYAAAATIYRAVAGQAPLEALDRMAGDELVPPSELGAEIDRVREEALTKALAVDPEERYKTLEDFQAALFLPQQQAKEDSWDKPASCPICNRALAAGVSRCGYCDAGPAAKEKTGGKERAGARSGPPHLKIALALVLVLALIFGAIRLLGGGAGDLSAENGTIDAGLAVEGETEDDEKDGETEGELSLEYRGNSLGNIVNVGIAASFGDRVYFRRDGDGSGIYSSDLDGRDQFLLVPDDAWNINAADGWLYYSNRVENWHVYKVQLDGSERTRINSDDSGNLQLVGEWLYYRNDDDGGSIYRMRTDGSGRQKIHGEESYFLNVSGEWIYFQNRSDGGRIYKVRTDGSGRTRINDDDSWNINVADGWIYYSTPDENWNIFKVRLDGSDRTRINRDDSGSLNVSGEWIFYRNDDENSTLYRMRTDGSGRTRLTGDQSYFFSVHGDWIYFQNRSDGRRTYRVRLDGSGLQAL